MTPPISSGSPTTSVTFIAEDNSSSSGSQAPKDPVAGVPPLSLKEISPISESPWSSSSDRALGSHSAEHLHEIRGPSSSDEHRPQRQRSLSSNGSSKKRSPREMLVKACQSFTLRPLSPRHRETSEVSHTPVEVDPAPPHSPRSPRSLRSFLPIAKPHSSHIVRYINPLSVSEVASSSTSSSSKISFSLPEKPADDHKLQSVIAYLTQEQKSNPRLCAQAIWNRCFLHPEMEGSILQEIAEMMEAVPPHYKERINPLLHQLFLNHKKTPFFSLLLKKMHADVNETAEFLVKEILSSSLDPLLLVNLINKHTECDLADATSATLFRSTNFSSSLCKYYGIYSNQEKLDLFYEFVLHKLDSLTTNELMSLWIEPRHLRETDPDAEEAELIAKALQNFSFFSHFVSEVLDKLYQIEFSLHFSAVLTMRRNTIEKFLKQNPSTSSASDPFQLSRIYIGEIPFLRILNSQLPLITTNLHKRAVLIPLTKFLQQLTNEVAVGGIEPNPIHSALNQLYQQFLPRHREFIDRCSSKSF